jgi:hypothetical protein
VDEFRDGLEEAWRNIAEFLPTFVGFLLILIVGYFAAKLIARVVDRVLERVGFDRAVERGGVGRALARSKYDASSLLSRIVFYALMLFVLQLAFGLFDPNPVSDLIQGVIAYLPKIFAAILIVVVGAAIAAGVKEIVEASIGGLSYGRTLAFLAGGAVLFITFFAALNQLEIAQEVFNGLYFAVLAIIVGSAIVAIGGGGIRTMQRYWERAATRAEEESSNIKREAEGSKERIQQRAQERAQQVQGAAGSEEARAGAVTEPGRSRPGDLPPQQDVGRERTDVQDRPTDRLG